MDASKLFSEMEDFIAIECCNPKRLKNSEIEELQNRLGFSFQDKVYRNQSNLILTSYEDWENIKYMISTSDVIAKIQISEYNLYLYVINFKNNLLIDEALI